MKKLILLTGLAGALLAATAGFAADDATTNTPAPAADSADTTPPPPPAPDPAAQDQTPQPPSAADQAPAAPVPIVPTPVPVPVVITPAPVPASVTPLAPGEAGLRMNFKNAPLEQVLNYMSDAAGYIIVEKNGVDSSAKVNLMSAQPVSKEEAVKLLKQMLNENGYTANQDGRTLTIVSLRDVNKSEVTVGFGSDFQAVPKTPDYRTQVVPVHTLNVVQLVKELDTLRPADTTLQADEAANAIIITGPQSSIRHLMEVVKALDGVNSGNSIVSVFPLKYADAKDLATHIKDLFPSADTTGAGARNPFARLGGRGGGGGFPFGGGFPGGGGGGDTGGENGHTPTAKVEATSDDHSNSLIVSAPDELMDTISNLVNQLDIAVEDTTLVKIFPLRNADATEMANLITSLFPDDTTSTTPQIRAFGFAGGFGGFGGRGNNASTTPSDRSKKMSHVSAVPDARTRSLVVTAGKDLMPEIESMVASLDSSDAGKLKPHVIPLANAEPIDVLTILQSMYPSSMTTGNASQINSTTSNPLLNRQNTLLQQQNNTTTSSFGSGSTLGGTGRGN